MIPAGITAEHVRKALRDLDSKAIEHRFADSTRYDLYVDGRRYPPKAIVGLGTIRDLLGHTSTRMTERYAHMAPGHLHAAVQRLVSGARPSEIAQPGDPTGDPSTSRPPAPRVGPRPTSRPGSESANVPGGIRTHVPGVKGRCPRPD